MLADAGRMLSDQFIAALSDLGFDCVSFDFMGVDTRVCVLKKFTLVLGRKNATLHPALQHLAVVSSPELMQSIESSGGVVGEAPPVSDECPEFERRLLRVLDVLRRERAATAAQAFTYRL